MRAKAIDLVQRMDRMFKTDVIPVIEQRNHNVASIRLEAMLTLLEPQRESINLLPSGMNYLISLDLIQKQLEMGLEVSPSLIEDYSSYAAQVLMYRPT